ncbi:hypothetical protein ACLOJK_002856 [Asimina triloba]
MSSIPTDARWRGCSSSFPQPVNEENANQAEYWVHILEQFNPDIVYRSDFMRRNEDGGREYDIIHHVFRWNTTPYNQVLRHGFRAPPQGRTPDNVYFNLNHHVHEGGAPLDPNRPPDNAHFFVSTTISSEWRPQGMHGDIVYRYEIYAPGGIWVAQTLEHYRYPNQDEVAFPAGIAPQYILSAQAFRRTSPPNARHLTLERVGTELRTNRYFNPQPSNPRLCIRNRISYYMADRRRVDLTFIEAPSDDEGPSHARQKRQAFSNGTKWYDRDVVNVETYISAAFRSFNTNEAYVFMGNEYVRLNYAPHSTGDWVMNGPLLISRGYPSLARTPFAEYGIDCAFGSQKKNQAFIFAGNLCAQIDYAPGTTDDRIIKGPMPIGKMFPYLKGTVFESGIDAAFEIGPVDAYENQRTYKAYIFKNNHCALIDYTSSSSFGLSSVGLISEQFLSLKNTVFESGMDAAFALHDYNEAYLFKGDSYALFHFAPGYMNNYIVDGVVKKIHPNWPSLRPLLPRKNGGLDGS